MERFTQAFYDPVLTRPIVETVIGVLNSPAAVAPVSGWLVGQMWLRAARLITGSAGLFVEGAGPQGLRDHLLAGVLAPPATGTPSRHHTPWADWRQRGGESGGRDAETAVRTGDLGLVLLIGAAVVIAAIVAARVAHGVGLPALLLFLGLGLALGEAGIGVRFDNAGLAQTLGLSAL